MGISSGNDARFFKTLGSSYVVGGPTPLKNINRLGLLFPIYGKIKSVPNHQPVIVRYSTARGQESPFPGMQCITS